MVTDELRALVRRYPLVRFATRRLRARLPRRWGGLDPDGVPPWTRHLTLDLPRPPGWPGPARLDLEVPGDLAVPRRLERFGLAGHEPASLGCFLAAVEHAGPGTVLDVGAGVGVYAALAATRSRRQVYAFEPAPEPASAARSVSEASGRGFTVVETAVGDYDGTARLRRCLGDGEGHPAVAADTRHGLGHTRVPMVSLSRWCEEAGIRPGVVVVDTCGTEPDVIAGALEVLRRHRPWLLVKVRADRGSEERLMALLEPSEYAWYPVGGRSAGAHERIAARESPAAERMWLLAPHEPPARFWVSVRAWREAVDGCLPPARPASRN